MDKLKNEIRLWIAEWFFSRAYNLTWKHDDSYSRKITSLFYQYREFCIEKFEEDVKE